MADIDVQLYLAAHEDINRLIEALKSFDSGAASLERGSKSKGGTGTAKVGGSHGLPSQMTLTDRQAYNAYAATPKQFGDFLAGDTQQLGAFNRAKNWAKFRGAQVPGAGVAAGFYNEMPGRNLVQKAGWGLAFGPQAMHSAAGLAGGVGNMMFGGGFTAAGTQLGQSNNGIGGFGIGSQAWQTGVLNSLYGQIQGLEGNPYAAQGVGIAAQSGFNPGNNLIQAITGTNTNVGSRVSAIASSALKQGATEDVVSQWVESLRYGSTNLEQLNGRIKDLGNLARGAHMSVGAFTSQLQQVSDQMQTNLGMTNGQAFGQVGRLSAMTGLTPSLLGQVTSDKSNMWLSIANHGGDAYKALQGSQAGMGMIQAFGMKILGVAGFGSYKDAAAFFKTHKPGTPQYDRVWTNLLLAYQNGLVPFPPQQAITFMVRMGSIKDTKAAMAGLAGLQHDMGTGHAAHAGLNKISGQLRSSGLLTGAQVDKIMHGGGSNMDKINKLAHQAGINSGKKTDDMAGSVNIKFTGYAEKFLQVDKSTSNQNTANGRPAATYQGLPARGPGYGS